MAPYPSATSLAGVIQSTRYKAIATGCPYEVVITASTLSYQILTEPVVISATAPVCGTTYSNVGNTVTFANSDVVINANQTLVLNPSGTISAVGSTTVPSTFTIVFSIANGSRPTPLRFQEWAMSASNKVRGDRGFTLLEIMIATVILIIGLSAMAALAAVMLTRGRQSRYVNVAETLASEKLEDLNRYHMAAPQIACRPATPRGRQPEHPAHLQHHLPQRRGVHQRQLISTS